MQVSSNPTVIAVPRGTGPSHIPDSVIHDFGHILCARVYGHPTPIQLARVEHHLRELNATPEGADALRHLRLLGERHHRCPRFVFDADAPEAVPLVRPDARHVRLDPGSHRDAGPLRRVSRGDAAPRGTTPDGAVDEFEAQVNRLAALQKRLLGAPGGHHAVSARRQDATPSGPVATPSLLRATGHETLIAGRLFPTGSSTVEFVLNGTAPEAMRAIMRVLFDMLNGEARTAASTLSDSVTQWLGCRDETVEGWAGIEAEARGNGTAQGVAAFHRLLLDLAATPSIDNPTSRASVTAWLARAAHPDRAALRAAAFRICLRRAESPDETCQYTWNRLARLMLTHDVEAGKYAGRTAALYATARSAFLVQEIDRFIEQHAALLSPAAPAAPDPAAPGHPRPTGSDVRAASPSGPSADMPDLGLPDELANMYARFLVRLPAQALHALRDTLCDAQKHKFAAWLVLDFEPFMAEVRRQLGPAPSANIAQDLRARLHALREPVARWLDGDGAPRDPHSEMGARLRREIEYGMWRKHANAVLVPAGLPPLPPSPWGDGPAPAP